MILGAVIALVSSAVLPWIREAISARRAERASRRTALESSIRRVVHALVAMSFERPMSEPDRAKIEIATQDTLVELELLLDGRSQPIGAMLDQAFRDAGSDNERLRSVVRGAVPLLLTGWHGGICTGTQAYTSYNERREAALGQSK